MKIRSKRLDSLRCFHLIYFTGAPSYPCVSNLLISLHGKEELGAAQEQTSQGKEIFNFVVYLTFVTFLGLSMI